MIRKGNLRCYARSVASPTRSYQDPCGIARALDLVGERWALLVVRELMLGPKRFTQLRRGLGGASPNVVSQRLEELTAAGVVRRYKLDPPASALVYDLTDRGHALEPILLELGRWGSQAPITSSADLSPDAFALALKTTFDPLLAGKLSARYEVRLGDDRFRIAVAAGRIDVARGAAELPDALVTTDVATMRSLVFGRASLSTAEESGRIQLEGNRKLVKRLTKLFPV
jgi:DNA-binding HxlR family transcriptional regulator